MPKKRLFYVWRRSFTSILTIINAAVFLGTFRNKFRIHKFQEGWSGCFFLLGCRLHCVFNKCTNGITFLVFINITIMVIHIYFIYRLSGSNNSQRSNDYFCLIVCKVNCGWVRNILTFASTGASLNSTAKQGIISIVINLVDPLGMFVVQEQACANYQRGHPPL